LIRHRAVWQDFYCIDLADVNPNLPIGKQQKVIAEQRPDYNLSLAKITRPAKALALWADWAIA